ncbi:SDR family oxidoreductase [Enterococcus sp. LJL120]
MMGRFTGKVILVTGGAAGIGFEIAKLFLTEGAKRVYSFDVQVGPDLPNFVQKKVNITDKISVNQGVQEILNNEEGIDILINNAGVTRDKLLNKLNEEDWDFVIDVNLKGTFLVTQKVVEGMLQKGVGAIVNLSSIVGIYGNIGQSNYAATKSGVIGLTYTWAKEFTRKGANIRTNAVAPGYVNTEMVQTVPEKILEQLKAQNPLKRLAEPSEIAQAVAFLASDQASFVNGHVLSVDGGMRI